VDPDPFPARAHCQDLDPSLFDCDGAPAPAAIAACASCPVRRRCGEVCEKEEALLPLADIHGYVAGTTAAERRRRLQALRQGHPVRNGIDPAIKNAAVEAKRRNATVEDILREYPLVTRRSLYRWLAEER